MAIGFLLSPRATSDWLDYIAKTPFLARALKHQPKLITKIYRPYLATGYSCSGRVQILKTHYQTAQTLGLAALMDKALLAPQLIFQGSTKSASTFELHLSASIQGHREGEFCLSLIYQGHSLFELNCTLAVIDNKPCLLKSLY